MRPRVLFGAVVVASTVLACGSVERRSAAARPAPVVAETPAEGPLRVAAGAHASCALGADGVRCWGGGSPDAVVVPDTAGAVDVAAAGRHVCALLADGGVTCASFPGSFARVPEVRGARQLAVGPEHGCAADGEGRVTCWGEGTFGRLGRDGVAELVGVEELALGTAHSCALLGDGRVSCWGLGADPEARCHTEEDETITCEGGSPGGGASPRVVEGLGEVQRIAAAGHHTCALARDGVVHCFDVRRKYAEGRHPLRRMAQVRGGEDLTVGDDLGCVLADRRIQCWGKDDRGQRGDGDGVMGLHEVSGVAGLEDVVDVDAGRAHACAVVRGGEVFCWGANDAYQLGDGNAGFDGSPAAFAVPGLADVEGDASLLCALLSDGTAQCLGRNERGQLGDGTLVSHWDFSPVVDLSQVVQIDVEVDHVCAVDRRGELRCWGDNRRLFLGPSNAPDPPKLSTPVRATWLRGVAEVATSAAGTCARTRSGRVSCFGRPSRRPGEASMGAIAEVSGATDLDGRAERFCAVAGGRVRCWGAETDGAGSTPVVGIADARGVAVGCTFACALRAAGVSCWGEVPAWAPSSEPFDIPETAGAEAIEAGCRHACARMADGAITCWGANAEGQLGMGRISGAERAQPLSLRGTLHVLDRATCVDQGGGALTCFGEVPGVPERADRLSPVIVSISPHP